jgi:CRISPR/Cas system CMR subunit Cmr4 (Cas7 group RAMP superfamily)
MTPRPYIHFARFDVEALSALSVSTGASDPIWDNMLVRDANGLPILAGSSLAGVLRAAFTAHDREFDVGLFGTQATTGRTGESDASSVSVSDGLAIGASEKVVEGLDFAEAWRKDKVLEWLAHEQPVRRDHNRLNAQGAVDGSGKFAWAGLPAGVRFRFQLEYQSEEEEPKAWLDLASAITREPFRIGGKTRSGRGLLKTIRHVTQTMDIRRREDRVLLSDWTRLGSSKPMTPANNADTPTERFAKTWEFVLEPESYFRFGSESSKNISGDSKAAKVMVESVITWFENSAPKFEERLVIPATGLKGALRHRTEFHYRCRRRKFGHTEVDLSPLFGSAREAKKGSAGRLQFSDFFLPVPAELQTMSHSGIDRFTGGVRRRVLFSEELVSAFSTGGVPVRIGYQGGEIESQLLAARRQP